MKDEEKMPTHEEIMTKWWKVRDGYWFKVIVYDQRGYFFLDKDDPERPVAVWSKETFIGKVSADIPPENK